MSILAYQEILVRCGLAENDDDNKTTETGIIRPCKKGNVRSAGYDLTLGDEFYLAPDEGGKRKGGCIEIQSFANSRSHTVSIPPNQVIIASVHEKLCMPKDIVGHLSLKLNILLQGIIMASQSQIDAGYEGELFVLLYNLSDRPVSLQLGQSILRLELAQLTVATSKPYQGEFKNRPLGWSVTERVGSSLHEMREEIDKMRSIIESTKDQLRWTQVGLAAGAIMLTVIISVFSYFGPLTTRLKELEDGFKNMRSVTQLEETYRKQLEQIEQEVAALRKQVATSPAPPLPQKNHHRG